MRRFSLFGFPLVSANQPVPGLFNGELFCNLNTVSLIDFGGSDSPVDYQSFLGPNVIGTQSVEDFSSLASKFPTRNYPLSSGVVHSSTGLSAVELSGPLGTATVKISDGLMSDGLVMIQAKSLENIVTDEFDGVFPFDGTFQTASIKHGSTEIGALIKTSTSWALSISDDSANNKTILWKNESITLSSQFELKYSDNNLSVISGGDEIMTIDSNSVQLTIEDMTIEILQNLVIVTWEDDRPLTYWISMSDGAINCFVDNSGSFSIGAVNINQNIGLAAALVRATTIRSLYGGPTIPLLPAYSVGAAGSGPVCKPELPRYDELMVIDANGNIVAARKPMETCIRVCRMRGGYNGGSCGCAMGRLENNNFTPVCSVRESNSFAVTSIYSLLVTSCLTPGSFADNESDVIECVINTLPSSVGITLLGGLCFDCLIDFIDTDINRAPSNVRAACTADPVGSECLSSVDFSKFALCSNGYDPQYPVIQSYCSETERRRFIETSVYRTITETCLTDIPNLPICLEKIEADLRGITPDCFSCWSDLFDSFMDMLICESDSNKNCTTTLSGAIARFRICAGFDPLEMDKVMKTHSQYTLTRSNVTVSAAFSTIVTILMISMYLFH